MQTKGEKDKEEEGIKREEMGRKEKKENEREGEEMIGRKGKELEKGQKGGKTNLQFLPSSNLKPWIRPSHFDD